MNIFLSTWCLLVAGLVFALPMIHLRVKETSEDNIDSPDANAATQWVLRLSNKNINTFLTIFIAPLDHPLRRSKPMTQTFYYLTISILIPLRCSCTSLLHEFTIVCTKLNLYALCQDPFGVMVRFPVISVILADTAEVSLLLRCRTQPHNLITSKLHRKILHSVGVSTSPLKQFLVRQHIRCMWRKTTSRRSCRPWLLQPSSQS